MKKSEMIANLKQIKIMLEMNPQEFAEYINEKHHNTITTQEAWAYRTGVVLSEINWMLKN